MGREEQERLEAADNKGKRKEENSSYYGRTDTR